MAIIPGISVHWIDRIKVNETIPIELKLSVAQLLPPPPPPSWMDSCTDYEIAEHTRNNYRGRVLLRYEIVYGQLPQKLMGPSVIILMTIQGAPLSGPPSSILRGSHEGHII